MLYLVVKTIEAYVQADGAQAAKWVELEESGCDVTITATPIRESAKWVPRDWLTALPFRDESDKSEELTVGQLLAQDHDEQ